MPKEHNFCCKSQTENCSQIKDIHNSYPASVTVQPFAGKKKWLGKGDATGVKQRGVKQDAKKQKKRVDCVATCGSERRQQQENVNMNRQYDAVLSKGGETIPLSQREIISQDGVAEVKPDGHNGAGESPAGSKRQLHMVTTARCKLSSTKSQMKKLVNHNTRKITVFEPRQVESTSADVNANKTATGSTKSEASSRVIKRHKPPRQTDKGKKKNSLNLVTTDIVPLVDADNMGYLSETSSPSTTEGNSTTGISQDLKLTKQSKSTLRNGKSATLSISHKKSTSEDIETPEKSKNINIEKAHKQNRISKQGTFLIEKPKLAWSSPAIRSKCAHSLTGSSLQVETLVTCLQSPKSVKRDSGEEGQNKEEGHATGITVSHARDEQSKSLHKETRMRQSYSSHSSVDSKEESDDDNDNEDVADDNVNMEKDSDEDCEEDSVEDVAKASEDNGSPCNKEKSNIPYEPLSWVTTANDRDGQSSTNNHISVSQCQDIDSKNCPTEHKKTKKMSRLKKIKKSFAKLPKGISENFINILPSSSIFLKKGKFRGSKLGKVNVTNISADDKETKSTSIKCEDESRAVFETVTMRHASMQTKHRAASKEDFSQKL